METNRVRHDKNKAGLTGRHDGLFLLEGQPRGGGSTGKVEIVSFTLYKATYAEPDEVIEALGLSDTVARTPYEDLHAQVEPVPMIKRTTYNLAGTPIHVEVQPESQSG